MAAVPKQKPSKGRRNRRRSQQKLKAQKTQECPNCGESKLSHQVCPGCGYYKGKKVL